MLPVRRRRRRLPQERSHVVALGTAISVFSMASGLGLGTLASLWAGQWASWVVGPLAMGFAGFYPEAGGVDAG